MRLQFQTEHLFHVWGAFGAARCCKFGCVMVYFERIFYERNFGAMQAGGLRERVLCALYAPVFGAAGL